MRVDVADGSKADIAPEIVMSALLPKADIDRFCGRAFKGFHFRVFDRTPELASLKLSFSSGVLFATLSEAPWLAVRWLSGLLFEPAKQAKMIELAIRATTASRERFPFHVALNPMRPKLPP